MGHEHDAHHDSSAGMAHHLQKAYKAHSMHAVGTDSQQYPGGGGWLAWLHASSDADAWESALPVGTGICGAVG